MSVGTYQVGDVVACENCNKHNFFLSLDTNDVFGAIPQSVFFDPSLNPNGKIEVIWCKFCSHQQPRQDTIKAERYICPECKKANIHLLEPTRIDQNDCGDRFFCYSSHETTCDHCNAEFKKFVMVNDENEPDKSWWVTHHLERK